MIFRIDGHWFISVYCHVSRGLNDIAYLLVIFRHQYPVLLQIMLPRALRGCFPCRMKVVALGLAIFLRFLKTGVIKTETTCIEVQGAPTLGLKFIWSEGEMVIIQYGKGVMIIVYL